MGLNNNFSFFLVRENSGIEEPLDLVSNLRLGKSPSLIKENEIVSFVLYSVERLSEPTLWIQDFPLPCSEERIEAEDKYKYYWRPDENKFFFINHFGQSELTLELYYMGEERTEILLYTLIEVIARKLNAERAEQMLDYLENKMDDITRFCFSLTHKRSGAAQNNERHASILLQEIRRGLEVLVANLPQFIERKRCRLTPKPVLVDLASANSLNEHSTNWVLSHLDCLVPVKSPSYRSVAINNRFFEAHSIEASQLHENTDVYENQVIAGFLDNIAKVLSEIEREYKGLIVSLESEEPIKDIPVGYQSMFSIRKKFGGKYFNKLLSECMELHLIRDRCSAFFRKHLPVTRLIKETPKMTPGFFEHPHYRKIFYQIIDWQRLGKLNNIGERFLYGLRSLDKLYEFFCLYQIVESLIQCGFELALAQHSNEATRLPNKSLWNAQPADDFLFLRHSGEQINLRYEPHILPASENQSKIVDIAHSHHGKFRWWMPDFVIELSASGKSTFIILDAKYKRPDDAFNDLKELTWKYVHGIGKRNGGHSPVLALYILHPAHIAGNFKHPYRFYHQEPFDIFSSSPALPAIGAISVTPEKHEDAKGMNESISLVKVLAQTTRVLSSHLSKAAFQEDII